MNSPIVSSTAQQVAHLPSRLTPAIAAYLGLVTITAQATHDRWPEAVGMRRVLYRLGNEAGLSGEQVSFDMAVAPCDRTGGRW